MKYFLIFWCSFNCILDFNICRKVHDHCTLLYGTFLIVLTCIKHNLTNRCTIYTYSILILHIQFFLQYCLQFCRTKFRLAIGYFREIIEQFSWKCANENCHCNPTGNIFSYIWIRSDTSQARIRISFIYMYI